MRKMNVTSFPDFVACVLNQLISEEPTQAIWFIGSRANGSERIDSDWDFIAFVNDEIHERNARHINVDIVRVDKNMQCLLEGENQNLSGSFHNWRWRQIDTESSLYTYRKTPDVENGQGFDIADVEYIDLHGIKVWEKNA